MRAAKIIKLNSQTFLDDLKRAKGLIVFLSGYRKVTTE